jgi:hypothetical protein
VVNVPERLADGQDLSRQVSRAPGAAFRARQKSTHRSFVRAAMYPPVHPLPARSSASTVIGSPRDGRHMHH